MRTSLPSPDCVSGLERVAGAVGVAHQAAADDAQLTAAIICDSAGNPLAEVELRGLFQLAVFTGELVGLGYAPHKQLIAGSGEQQRTVRFVPDIKLRILARM